MGVGSMKVMEVGEMKNMMLMFNLWNQVWGWIMTSDLLEAEEIGE
jgi:hypothetical protein